MTKGEDISEDFWKNSKKEYLILLDLSTKSI